MQSGIVRRDGRLGAVELQAKVLGSAIQMPPLVNDQGCIRLVDDLADTRLHEVSEPNELEQFASVAGESSGLHLQGTLRPPGLAIHAQALFELQADKAA